LLFRAIGLCPGIVNHIFLWSTPSFRSLRARASPGDRNSSKVAALASR
jgi:hypothetical protein